MHATEFQTLLPYDILYYIFIGQHTKQIENYTWMQRKESLYTKKIQSKGQTMSIKSNMKLQARTTC